MVDTEFDVLIIGSGPAGVSAAYPLVQAGLKVAIVDGGLEKKAHKELEDFSDINLSPRSNAYELFLDNSYVFNTTYQLLKIKSDIEVIQSLAKGGLSVVWHGICDFFLKSELESIGLPAAEIEKEYQEVAKLMNLKLQSTQDLHTKMILKSAEGKSDLGSSVYSLHSAEDYCSSISIDKLKKKNNFTYIPGRVISGVYEKGKYIETHAVSLDKQKEYTYKSRFAILAAGSVNTTRILLRSFKLFNYKTSFLTKAHFIIACLQPKTLFKRPDYKEVKIGQLAMSSKETDKGLSSFFIQLYQFNPLAVIKAVKYVFLPKQIAKKLLSFLAPSLVVADIRFPAFESKNKFCVLKKEKDREFFTFSFKETNKEFESHKKEIGKIKKQLRTLGLIPLKVAGDYVTAHYAGGVPFQSVPGKLSANQEGRLHQAKRIYVADSSTWRALPGKSPTLTIMANAQRIGKIVAEKFNKI